MSENTKKSDKEENITSSSPSITRKTTGTNSSCLSTFGVAVELHNELPHSSYTICNTGIEQLSPTDSKTFVYNSDFVMDDLMADSFMSAKACFDQKVTCVRVVTACKKSDAYVRLPSNVTKPLTEPQSSLLSESVNSLSIKGITKDGDDVIVQGGPEEQSTAKGRFKCDHKGCEKSFVFQAHLCFHIQHAHKGCSPYICDFEGCGRCFFSEYHLIVHLQAHTGAKPFACPYDKCKRSFTTAGNLRNHIRTHTGEKPYKCSYKGCDKRFAELSSMRKHKLTHTGEKPHPCRICGRCFSQAGSRNTHERLKHKDKVLTCNM